MRLSSCTTGAHHHTTLEQLFISALRCFMSEAESFLNAVFAALWLRVARTLRMCVVLTVLALKRAVVLPMRMRSTRLKRRTPKRCLLHPSTGKPNTGPPPPSSAWAPLKTYTFSHGNSLPVRPFLVSSLSLPETPLPGSLEDAANGSGELQQRTIEVPKSGRVTPVPMLPLQSDRQSKTEELTRASRRLAQRSVKRRKGNEEEYAENKAQRLAERVRSPLCVCVCAWFFSFLPLLYGASR